MAEDKLLNLLGIVIDNYINKWDPIWSKFLHTLETLEYAPSTLRKYLNLLEKEGLVYQPYNSSGRIPTVQGLSLYLEEQMENKPEETIGELAFDVNYARHGLRYIVETLGKVVDGAVVGFLKNDEYYFLGINNLLQNAQLTDMDTTKYIVQYIEDKRIVSVLDSQLLKKEKVYYTFIQAEDHVIATIYAKITVNGYDGIISIMWPTRTNYKKNLSMLQKFLAKFNMMNT